MKVNKMKEKENRSLKIRFYIMSLWLLFLLIFVLTVDISSPFDSNGNYLGTMVILSRNWMAITSLALCVLGLCFAQQIKYEWKGVTNPPYRIKEVRNENYEYLTFLTTYIIPLICIDLEKLRYVLVLGILLVIIGLIFIKMDLYYGNPTLALMGYRIYRIEVENVNASDGVVIITKDKVHRNDQIRWMPIDSRVWVVKVVEK